MQLTVTVVSPAAGRRADVLIDAAAETAVAQVAAELDRLMHAGPGFRFPALFVGGHRVPGDMQLADAPVLDGCVVSLGDPAGCPRPEPTGVAEALACWPTRASPALPRPNSGRSSTRGCGSWPDHPDTQTTAASIRHLRPEDRRSGISGQRITAKPRFIQRQRTLLLHHPEPDDFEQLDLRGHHRSLLRPDSTASLPRQPPPRGHFKPTARFPQEPEAGGGATSWLSWWVQAEP